MFVQRRLKQRYACDERAKLSQEMLHVAHSCASQIGLSADDAEDCAISFVERMLIDSEEKVLRSPDKRSEVGTFSLQWVRHCALNHARNFRRHNSIIQSHESHWPDSETCQSSPELLRILRNVSPEAFLLRNEYWRSIASVMAHLEPMPRELLLLHHLSGYTIAELSAYSGRTPHAVEQTLSRTRRHIRALLGRQGTTEAELRFHFAS